MSDDENQREAADAGSDLPTESGEPEGQIDEMEHGIERVDEEIDEAKKNAERATSLDPQPRTAGTEGEPTSDS